MACSCSSNIFCQSTISVDKLIFSELIEYDMNDYDLELKILNRYPIVNIVMTISSVNANLIDNSINHEVSMSCVYNNKIYLDDCYTSAQILKDSTFICNAEFIHIFKSFKDEQNDKLDYLKIINEIIPTLKFNFRYDYFDEETGNQYGIIETSDVKNVEIKWTNKKKTGQ